ncbi:MAG: tripartite tricarboxylate transporter substrate binding protein [Betaproteobacteria bacterium]|nr:tripartite tricarboxylate transporter substrate binding protein [Betaproteobacteria bacterium]
MQKFVRCAAAAFLCVLSLHAAPSLAQTWPQRTVRFVLPLGPGSGVDIGARLLAERLTALWGQPAVVENRPGGDGLVAVNAVLSARDDHTLLFSPAGSFVGHPYLLEKMTYDPRDLVPVARVSNTVVVIAVPASLKVGSLKELVAMARAQPGKLNWTTATGVTDLVIAGYLKGAGLDMVKVAYRDPVSALNDLIEGRIHLYSAAYAIVRAQAQAGRVKLLALQTRGRVPALSELQTVAELGFSDLNFDGLVGLVAARGSGITDALRERIAADVSAVVADPVVAGRLTATGQLVSPGTPAEFGAAIDEQAGHLAAIIKVLGAKPAL